MSVNYQPFVPSKIKMKEFSLKAVLLGMIMSILLGAANAYLGLKVGMTVAATFPAAVIAMAVLRLFGGTILEENTCRTTAAVGEAMAAGAIFTVPAFLIALPNEWKTLHYGQTTILMLLGGVLGVLFVIFLRRILVEDQSLPFPESQACAAIVKAGQKGQSGAKFVFGSLGLGAVIQFFKARQGMQLFADSTSKFLGFKQSTVSFVTDSRQLVGNAQFHHSGGVFLQSPEASPAMMSVGYIIGPRLSSIVFAGGVLAWFVLVPAILFLQSTGYIQLFGFDAAGRSMVHIPGKGDALVTWSAVAAYVWKFYVRPLAVGAMIVSAFYTLWKMRGSLWLGIKRAAQDMKRMANKGTEGEKTERTQQDFPLGLTAIAIVTLTIPIAIVYYMLCKSVLGAVVAAVVMTLAGFLFAAVAGYLVGTIGSSNNPISGLTLSTLVVAALLMLAVGVKGNAGVAAVLGVATVVCVSSGVAGDMLQDLKVGHILGGTPWKMELGCILGVVAAALVMVIPIMWLHKAIGIGSESLPAPQAGLMAMLAQGIISQQMAWPLVGVGAAFAVAMILIQAPSPMLIAIGMYLPFTSTTPIFLGGIVRWIVDKHLDKKKVSTDTRQRVENTGTLLASGLIAGEAITGIALAGVVIAGVHLPHISEVAWPGFAVILGIAALLIFIPLAQTKGTTEPPTEAKETSE